MRLDRFIARATGLSRQQVQRAVRSGAVTVNGNAVRKADTAVSGDDQVLLDNEPVIARLPRYYMLHKPAGYLCANTDGNHPLVLDLLNEPFADELQIAGRLDLDTTGLLLLTDDGQWNHRITAPSRRCEKTYRVTLATPLDDTAADYLREGVQLRHERHPTRPAQVGFPGDTRTEILLTISEGKYHQVKRMLAAVGNHVIALHRERIGAIVLDPALEPGQYRSLTAEEITGVG